MSESINKRAIIVGVFIFVGLLFLLGGILTVGNLHSTFEKKMTITTIFGDVNGLVAGNNIWFSGVKIGTVKKMEFYGKSQVKVIMNLNTEAREYIRKDAKVKISTDGFIGNKILVIYGGSSSVPQVQEGDVLANETLLTTEDIMNTFQENNLNILALTKKLSAGEGTVGKLLNSDSIYNSLAATSRSLQIAAGNARTVVASISDFSSNLKKRGTLANELVTDTTVFRSIRRTATSLQYSVAQLQNTATEFSAKLNKKGTSIDNILNDTVVYNSIKASVFQLQNIADTAAVFVSNLQSVSNTLKEASTNPKSPVGVLLYDEQVAANLKTTIKNLEQGSEKLNEDLEALQHNFLLRGYFKKKAKNQLK